MGSMDRYDFFFLIDLLLASALRATVDLPISDWEDVDKGDEEEEEVKGSSKKKAKHKFDQLKLLQEKVCLLSVLSSGFCDVLWWNLNLYRLLVIGQIGRASCRERV